MNPPLCMSQAEEEEEMKSTDSYSMNCRKNVIHCMSSYFTISHSCLCFVHSGMLQCTVTLDRCVCLRACACVRECVFIPHMCGSGMFITGKNRKMEKT